MTIDVPVADGLDEARACAATGPEDAPAAAAVVAAAATATSSNAAAGAPGAGPAGAQGSRERARAAARSVGIRCTCGATGATAARGAAASAPGGPTGIRIGAGRAATAAPGVVTAATAATRDQQPRIGRREGRGRGKGADVRRTATTAGSMALIICSAGAAAVRAARGVGVDLRIAARAAHLDVEDLPRNHRERARRQCTAAGLTDGAGTAAALGTRRRDGEV